VMPRPLRPVADGLLYHALNRGNNRAPVFFTPEDYHTFLAALAKTKRRYPFRLYGYCLMTNHFRLLLAPEAGVTVSRVLQSLTVTHTWHYHRRRGTVGHVWQGRFKSPVVQDDDHALVVLRYIEANPLRAGMVADLADHPWSSYGAHGLGRADPLLSALPAWEALGREPEGRRAYWRGWVRTPLAEHELAEVRRSVVSGRPFGAAAWAEAKTALLAFPPAPRPRGRPRKDREK
jgi:putative transposase